MIVGKREEEERKVNAEDKNDEEGRKGGEGALHKRVWPRILLTQDDSWPTEGRRHSSGQYLFITHKLEATAQSLTRLCRCT